MRKLIITILTVMAALSLYGCAEEENSPASSSRVYSVELKSNTVLDAENSYFLIEVNNAEEIEDVVLAKEEGETDEEYMSRYNYAVSEAKAKGTYILVEGLGLDLQTVVLNKDNGTVTNAVENKTLVIVKKEAATSTKQEEYKIQILLDARTAVKAKSVAVTVGNQRFLFNDFNVKPARIWKDENGNTITSINVPENEKDDKQEVIKKGINVISEPVKVPVYSYDSVNKAVAGPVDAKTDITGLINTNSALPFEIDNYSVTEDINAGIQGFSGCIANGADKCGITISGYKTISTEKELLLNITSTLNNGADSNVAVTSSPVLLLKGTKPVEYNILPVTSMYLDVENSAAIFDVKATTNNTISSSNIQVAGKYNGTNDFTAGGADASATLTTGTYIIKEIELNKHYRIFMLAKDAATAAANGGLIITVNGETNTYTANEVMVGNISYGYIAGNKLIDNYKLKLNSATKIEIKLNYFGAVPTLYTYNSSGDAASLFTTEQTFIPNLSPITNGAAIQVSNSTCTANSAAVNCTFTVTATQSITSANATTTGNIILPYVDGDSSTGTVTLPSTQLNFYTTEDTTTNSVSSY